MFNQHKLLKNAVCDLSVVFVAIFQPSVSIISRMILLTSQHTRAIQIVLMKILLLDTCKGPTTSKSKGFLEFSETRSILTN